MMIIEVSREGIAVIRLILTGFLFGDVNAVKFRKNPRVDGG